MLSKANQYPTAGITVLSKENKINTLKIGDKETLNYIIDKLEAESINYVVIKKADNCLKCIANDLLDYNIE